MSAAIRHEVVVLADSDMRVDHAISKALPRSLSDPASEP
jgi:hypothetical protein